MDPVTKHELMKALKEAIHANTAELISCDLCGKGIAWGFAWGKADVCICRECFSYLERRPN